jgi:ribosomal protein S18 acetylase RimI-like enzyme
MEELIREIREDELEMAAFVIGRSFATVAKDFHLTKENCPTNAAFITVEQLIESKNKGILFFGLFCRSSLAGCVAVEKAKDGVFYLEKLSVLPEWRHKGYGKKLTDFVFQYAHSLCGKKISIALINENLQLKKWYADYGFKETGIRKFNHLPFTVCFMEKEILQGTSM